jgi:hypothetical protein
VIDIKILWTTMEIYRTGMKRDRLVVTESTKVAGPGIYGEDLRIEANSERRVHDMAVSRISIVGLGNGREADSTATKTSSKIEIQYTIMLDSSEPKP